MDIEEFIQLELNRSTYLRNEGRDARSLLELFECELDPRRPNKLVDSREYTDIWDSEWEDSWIVDNRETWWYDLKCLMKLHAGPIPPLAPNWSRSASPDGVVKYTHRTRGIMTHERPNGGFFLNLKGLGSQRAYHRGKIRTETDVPCHWILTEEYPAFSYNNLSEKYSFRQLPKSLKKDVISKRKRRIWLKGDRRSGVKSSGVQDMEPGDVYKQHTDDLEALLRSVRSSRV